MKQGNSSVVEFLEQQGAKVGINQRIEQARQELAWQVAEKQQTEEKRLTALLVQATRNGRLDVIKSLVRNGANVNAKYLDDEPPLNWAVANGSLDVVELLVGQGASVNTENMKGVTPLMLAADRGHLDIVKFLVARGADVNAKNNNGSTPLTAATASRKLDVVEFLKQHGAKE